MMPPFTKGERVRIVVGSGRTASFDGFEGTVDGITDIGVIVVLDNDPANKFRINMAGGFTKPSADLIVRRFFHLFEIEKI